MVPKAKTSSPVIAALAFCTAFLLANAGFCQSTPTSPVYQKALQDELVYRVNFGRADDVKILLDRGAAPNATNAEGWPVIAIAADRTDAEGAKIVKTLAEGGADVNAADKTGSYAIINAARNNNLETVTYLLEHGADYTVKDAGGHTLLDIAKHAGNREILTLVQQKFDDETAHKAAVSSPENFVKLAEAYATSTCRYQYLSYYFVSGQDAANNAQTQVKIDAMRKQMSTDSQNLLAAFPTTRPDYFTTLAQSAMKPVRTQLDELISNRNRRANGVGSETDMNKRCSAIVQSLHITPPLKR